MNGNNKRATYDAIYFYSFGVEHIPSEIKKFMGNKNIITEYLQNTSTLLDNVWILLYRIY